MMNPVSKHVIFLVPVPSNHNSTPGGGTGPVKDPLPHTKPSGVPGGAPKPDTIRLTGNAPTAGGPTDSDGDHDFSYSPHSAA